MAVPVAVTGFFKALAWLVAITSVTMSIAKSMYGKHDSASAEERDPGLKDNNRSTQAVIRIVYGTQKVGGNDVFISTEGANSEFLWIVQTLSEGVCDSIVFDVEDQIWLGDKLVSVFGAYANYWFHDGASNQAIDSNLETAFPAWSDLMRYTCYITWKLEFNRDYFQNIPQRIVLLRGRELYDLRDSSTAWSDNPVIALYDYITSTRYGCGISSAKLDVTSWSDAADYCDTKGFTLNLVVTKDSAAIDTVTLILSHFRGELVWFDGTYYLRYSDLNEESSVMSISDEHIARDSDGTASISISEPSRFKKPDGIVVKYVDPELDYTVNDLPIGDESGIMASLELLGCTDREIAANLGVYALERTRLDRTVSGVFRDDCQKLEPHDLITLTSSALSISGQLMRVQDANIQPNGLVELSLIYEDIDLYNDDYDVTSEGTYTCTLPNPQEEPPSVSNVSTSEETYNYRLRTFTRLKVNFDPPSNYPWYNDVEVWVSYDDAVWEHLFNCTTDFEISNVEEGKSYYIRLKVVSIWGTKQLDANDFKIYRTIGTYSDPPDSVVTLHAVVNQSTVNLYSDKVASPDVELYEFRLGSSWSGGIFLAALRAPNLSLFGVKPGSHTFSLNTLSNNALYGGTPRSAVVSLLDPPDGWALIDSDVCDYDGIGTHDNTEHVIYDVEDYLKCSHTADVLTGTYTSPVYDLGSSDRYLCYVLADIVVTGAGTTWNAAIPSPDTWTDINISTRTWSEIFELSAGPKVSMVLKYGETNPPTSEVHRQEILSAIATGRYFQVEIVIVDPSLAVNALVRFFTLKYCQ